MWIKITTSEREKQWMITFWVHDLKADLASSANKIHGSAGVLQLHKLTLNTTIKTIWKFLLKFISQTIEAIQNMDNQSKIKQSMLLNWLKRENNANAFQSIKLYC